ncbi:hypothetical protein CC86DRAFT_293013 [Ophiobolus disseminans]|uniref:Uncharacterized protein n=1 Tax=Ophiobolus disseminans TaxID=1469910 RepID=A0A6A7A009_9PLEO|nr:hypothetical protein CC86DRAFT_293013 [Ophiobolus disseminans]
MPDHLDLGPAIPESPAYEAPTPRELLHVQDIYDAYVASYNDDITPQSVRMEIAQALALALLSHYYPESEGYVLQPSSLGPMAEHGMNFILKAPDGSDPDYMAPEPAPLPPVPVRKDPKKGKKFRPKPPSKARIAALMKVQAEEEYKRQFNSYWPFTVGLTWHQIEPEDISGYVVLKKYTTSNNGIEKVEYRLHTCLAIVLAPPDLLPQIAGTNDVQRGDILTDALSRSQQIRHGHGILLFGMWLELYDFDNGAGTTITGDVEAKYQEGTVSYEEPRVTMSQSADGQRLALDMRNAGLSVVDEVCRMVVQNEVVPTKEHSAEVGEIGMSGGYGGGS